MAQYIDKSAVVAEIERIKNTEYNKNFISDDVACCALDMVIDIIDTLKVKEVDLEKEIILYKMRNPIIGHREGSLNNYMSNVAKYFFELGLKLNKGE